MAIDTFIWFDHTSAAAGQPVAGETLDDFFKGTSPSPAFELKDWNFGASNKSTIGSATGGAGGGKAEFSEFSITKTVDSASPNFFLNCVTGTHYGTVTLACRKAGPSGDRTGGPYLRYIFQTVFTTDVKWAHSEEGPTETITFVYGQLKIEYTPQDSTGKVDTSKMKSTGWSVITNKKV
jgi:type VI secretion system secreted protein Hcp